MTLKTPFSPLYAPQDSGTLEHSASLLTRSTEELPRPFPAFVMATEFFSFSEKFGLQSRLGGCTMAPHSYGALAQLVERLHRTQQVRGSNPLCSIKKAPEMGAFFLEQFRGFSPCPLQAVDKIPGLPGARRA